MSNIKAAAALNAQHPDTWTPGAWYPATLPNGRAVQIKRTKPGFLHVRYEVPRVIVHEGSGLRENFGTTQVLFRVNLSTGAAEQL